MRSATSARILVVGAGIAGLGTARALARAGFAAEVVERQRTWQEAGAGIYLPGNAARALRALDLEHAVVDKAVVITSQRVCDHRGRQLLEVDVAGLWNGVGPCLALPRADLHAVLLEGAECRSGWMSTFAASTTETGRSRSSSAAAMRPSTTS